MAAGAVSGVLGAAQVVSGMSAQTKQRRAQQQAISAQGQAAVDEARLRQMDIKNAQMYAQYQSQMSQLSRMQAFQQQSAGLLAQAQLEQMQAAASQFENEQARMQALVGAEQQKQQANQQRLGATLNESEAKQQAAQQAGGVFDQLGQAEQQLGGALDEGQARRATMEAMFAASGLAPEGLTSNALQSSDMMNDFTAQVEQQLKASNLSEQAAFDMLSQGRIAELVKALGFEDAQRMDDEANRSAQYANTVADATNANINATLGQNAAARDTAMQQFKGSMALDEQTDKANQLFAEAGFNSQSNATQASLDSTMRGLAAQSSTVPSGGGFLGLLSGGLSVYNNVSSQMDNSYKRDMELRAGLLNGIQQPSARDTLLGSLRNYRDTK